MHPGKIDNSNLASDEAFSDPILKDNIIDGVDYVLIPGPEYQILLNHYNGGPNFFRAVRRRSIVFKDTTLIIISSS